MVSLYFFCHHIDFFVDFFVKFYVDFFCRVFCRILCRVLCRVLNHMFDKMAGNAGSVDEVSKLSTKSRNDRFRSRTQRYNIITKEHEA